MSFGVGQGGNSLHSLKFSEANWGEIDPIQSVVDFRLMSGNLNRQRHLASYAAKVVKDSYIEKY